MIFEEFTEGRAAAPFAVGDPVIITGPVEFKGKTGDVREIGRDGAFVVVDLYNYGPYSFHSSDVSYNDYADSEDELNEFALDDSDDPTEDYPCYDCGSTIFLHHTKLCDLAEPNAKRDLPAEPGTQYWTGEIPKGLAPIPGLAESANKDSATKKLSGATPAPAPNPYLKDILMRHIDEVRHFVNTGYIDPTRPMFEELYEYFANEIPDSVRRNPARLERRIGDMIAPHAKFYASAQSMNEQGVAEGKIKLSTDPNWYGAEVGDYKASGPVVNIPANRLVGFEPDDKMNQPASKANVEKIVAGLKQGAKLPPLMVRQYKNGYQVLDGHHRFWAYKLLGVKSIPAQVVPAEDIEEITKQGVAEEEKVGNMPADRFDSAMARLKQLAGAGPLKTVWDPQKRVYKNVPTAEQPKK